MGTRSPVDARSSSHPQTQTQRMVFVTRLARYFFATLRFVASVEGHSHDALVRSGLDNILSPFRCQIEKNRAAAFATLTTLAESLKFSQLDNELLIAPFDDVKQAAFYLPWALVKLDEDAGVKTQRRWLTFRERLIRLDAVAVDAARYQADEEEVLFAIAELESALDELLSDVPARLAR